METHHAEAACQNPVAIMLPGPWRGGLRMSLEHQDGKEDISSIPPRPNHAVEPNPSQRLWGDATDGLVIRQLIPFCGPPEIVALASLSWTSNRVVTQHILSLCGVRRQPASDIAITTDDPWTRRTFKRFPIPHLLAISFWIGSVRSFQYRFRYLFHDVARDLGHIAGVLDHFPESTVDSVILDFFELDIDHDAEEVDARRWERATMRILGVVESKKVRDFRMLDRQWLPGPMSHYQRREREGGTRRLVPFFAQSVVSDSPTPPASKKQIPKHTNPFKSILSSFGRKSQPSVQPSQQPQPFINAPFKPDFGSKSEAQVPTPSVPPDPPYTETTTAQVIYLDCPFLLCSPYIQRTVQFIASYSQELASLSFSNHDLDSETWEDVLYGVRLPNLARFIIRSGPKARGKGATARDLFRFFERHATITHLEMYGMQVAPESKVPFDAPILPNLSHLSAHSSYVALIVRSHTQSYEDRQSGSNDGPTRTSRDWLKSITITSETHTTSQSGVFRREPERIVQALWEISRLPFFKPIELVLEFSPSGRLIHEAWIRRVVQEVEGMSVCSRLYQVRLLVLECCKRALLTPVEINETLPAFFNLFPKGMEVYVQRLECVRGWMGRISSSCGLASAQT